MINPFGKKLSKALAKVAEIRRDSPTDLARDRIAAANDSDGVVAALRDTVRGIIDCDGVTIVRREGDEVVYLTEDAISPLWAGQRFPIRVCVSGVAIQARAMIAIPDILTDNRIPLNAYLATFVRSMVVVPIGHGEPMLAIGAYWQQPGAISAEAMERLTRIAGFAADALARIEGAPEPGLQVA